MDGSGYFTLDASSVKTVLPNVSVLSVLVQALLVVSLKLEISLGVNLRKIVDPQANW